MLDADSSETQYRQIELQIRSAITGGTLIVGARVPSSRKLAQILGVSRNTVQAAYEQLISRGYLGTSCGSGTRISYAAARSVSIHREPGLCGGPRLGGRLPLNIGQTAQTIRTNVNRQFGTGQAVSTAFVRHRRISHGRAESFYERARSMDDRAFATE